MAETTKKEKYNVIKKQLQSVANLVEESDPKVFALLEPAYSKISSMLFVNQDITLKRLEEARESLHILDSVITSMDDHGEGEEIKHEFFWKYLYGVHDTMRMVFEESEVEDAG